MSDAKRGDAIIAAAERLAERHEEWDDALGGPLTNRGNAAFERATERRERAIVALVRAVRGTMPKVRP